MSFTYVRCVKGHIDDLVSIFSLLIIRKIISFCKNKKSFSIDYSLVNLVLNLSKQYNRFYLEELKSYFHFKLISYILYNVIYIYIYRSNIRKNTPYPIFRKYNLKCFIKNILFSSNYYFFKIPNFKIQSMNLPE